MDKFLDGGLAPHLRFFGPGEPTMELGLLRRIVEYGAAKTSPVTPTIEIQTNGIFGAATARYLAENVDIIWVSCDGLPSTQDYYRRNIGGRGTSSILERNVRFLTGAGKGMTGIRATITEKNVREQDSLLRYFSELGVTHVWSDPIFPAIGESADGIELDVLEYAERFLQAQSTAAHLGITYGSILTANFDEEVSYNCRACLPTPHLTTDGYVSACDMALFGEDDNPMSVFIYGWWDPATNSIDLDEKKIAELRRRSAENMPGCTGCPARNRCAGYCLGEVMNETGSMFGRKPRTCEAIRYLVKRMPLSSLRYQYLHP